MVNLFVHRLSMACKGGYPSKQFIRLTPLPSPSKSSPSIKRVGPRDSHGLERENPLKIVSATPLYQSNNMNKNTSLKSLSEPLSSLNRPLPYDKTKPLPSYLSNPLSPKKQLNYISKGNHDPYYNLFTKKQRKSKQWQNEKA